MQARYGYLLKNLCFITLGKVLAKIVSILILPFYTSYLSPREFGYIDILVAYVSLFENPITLCIESAVFICPSGKNEVKKKRYFSSGLFFSLIPLVIFGLALNSLSLFFDQTHYSESSFIGGLANNALIIWLLMLFGFIVNYLLQILRVLDKIKLYAIAGVLQSIFMVIACFFLLPKFGKTGYMYALLLSSIMVAIFVFMFGNLVVWFSPSDISLRYYFKMLRFSIPLVPAPILVWVQTSLNKPLLSAYHGLEAVGIFSFACRFPSMLTYFADSLSKSWEISAIKEYRKEGFSRFYNRVCLTFFMSGLFLCIGLAIGIEPLFKFLINVRYYESIKYIPTVVVSFFFLICAQLIGVNLTICKESRKFLYSSVVAVVTAGFGNVILIPNFGIWGACVTMLVASLSVLVARYLMQRRDFWLDNILQIQVSILLILVWTIGYSSITDTNLRLLSTVAVVFAIAFSYKNLIFTLKRKIPK